jgi:hypothetical protein
MDGFEFTAALVESIAWPATIVTIALVFRHPVQKLIDRIAKRVGKMTEVSAWKIRAKFAEKTSQVNQDISDEASTIDPAIASNGDVPDYSGETPREIVMLAWLDFEEHLAAAAELAGLPLSGGSVLMRTKPFLPPDIQARARDLQNLRNEAVHLRDFSVSLESAIAYARAASKLGAIVRHPSVLIPMRNDFQKTQAPLKS